MVTDNDPRPVLRQELARIFKNQRVIRAFEKIFDLIPPEFIDQQAQIDGLAQETSSSSASLASLVMTVDQFEILTTQISDLQAQLAALQTEVQALKQGPVI